MSDSIWIPFPKDLYNLIIIRSGGELDPAGLAEHQVRTFIDQTSGDPEVWTDEGLEAFAEEYAGQDLIKFGDPTKGYQWQRVFLPNGTELRMTYKGRNTYARVQHEMIVEDGKSFSPAQWARKVANNTSRNAWIDIWVRRPGDTDWTLASDLRTATPLRRG